MTALRRIAAYAIDWCFFALWAGLTFVVVWFGQDGDPAWPDSPWLGQLIGFSLTALPFGLYFGLMEGSAWQATLGKRVLGLRVVTVAGDRVSRGRTLVRAAVKLLPWELGHLAPYQLKALDARGEDAPAWLYVAVGLGMALAAWYVVSLWSASGRTPYDRVAGTRVVGADRDRPR